MNKPRQQTARNEAHRTAMELINEHEFDFRDLQTLAGGEPRQGEFTGTKALMLAVLEDGIRSYLGSGTRVAQEAEHWVRSTRRQSPFSFEVVCETLNLDAGAVRRQLLRMRAECVPASKAVPRSRPNVRMTSRLCTRKRV